MLHLSLVFAFSNKFVLPGLRITTNNVASFFVSSDLLHVFSQTDSYSQMASAPRNIQIRDSNLGPATGYPQLFVVYLNPSKQMQA
jgi:hypothetical protein